jgi:hypothetical protein
MVVLTPTRLCKTRHSSSGSLAYGCNVQNSPADTHRYNRNLLFIADQPINSASMQSTRNRNIRRRRVNRSIAQKVYSSARKIALLTQALVRRSQPHLLALALARLSFADVPGLIGVNEAGRDGVDADAVWRQLDSEDSGEHHHAAFAGVVCGHSVAWQSDVR